MSIEAKTDQELKTLADAIKHARTWALKHFNADQAEDPRIIDENDRMIAAFFVEFPTADTMIVEPSFMGKRMGFPIFKYRLHFCKDGTLRWVTHNPFTGSQMPLLIVD